MTRARTFLRTWLAFEPSDIPSSLLAVGLVFGVVASGLVNLTT